MVKRSDKDRMQMKKDFIETFDLNEHGFMIEWTVEKLRGF